MSSLSLAVTIHPFPVSSHFCHHTNICGLLVQAHMHVHMFVELSLIRHSDTLPITNKNLIPNIKSVFKNQVTTLHQRTEAMGEIEN